MMPVPSKPPHIQIAFETVSPLPTTSSGGGTSGDHEGHPILASPTPSSSGPSQEGMPLHVFLQRCALKWPARTGAMSLAKAAAASGETYSALLARGISAADEEQIRLDVCRSGVDELERIAVAPHDKGVHREAIARLLQAWCARHRSSGYCQGMNFIASVLMAVMGHGAPPITSSPAAPPTPRARVGKPTQSSSLHPADRNHRVESLAAAEEGSCDAVVSSASVCGGRGSGSPLLAGEEAAFWTFVAIVEGILPTDLYTPPHMAGLQREVQVLQQLARKELPHLFSPSILGEPDALAVLSLVAYKWLPPCFVNQLPITTLVVCWDALLLRPSRDALLAASVNGGGTTGTRPSNLAAGHLKLSLALLAAGIAEVALRIESHRDDAVGLGFGLILESALGCTSTGPLLGSARRMEVTPDQLGYLRSRLAAADGKGMGGGPLQRPPITRLQETTLGLLSHHSPYLVEVLKEVLLVRPPQPPPVQGALSYLPHHYARLVSTCVITSASALLLAPHAVYRAVVACAGLLATPCTAARGVLRRPRNPASKQRDRHFESTPQGAPATPRVHSAAVGLLRSARERLTISRLASPGRFGVGILPMSAAIYDDTPHAPLPQALEDDSHMPREEE